MDRSRPQNYHTASPYAGLEARAIKALSAEEMAGLVVALERQAAFRAQLRLAHLGAHLATRALLTPAQVEVYQRLRGYRPAN